MAQGPFSAGVTAWIAETRERMAAVRQEAAQRVVEIMQTPGPSVATVKKAISAGAGLGRVKKNGDRGVSKKAFGPIPNPGGTGNLPVDSGFLRASLMGVIGEGTFTATEPPKDGSGFSYDAGQINLVIAGSKLTDTITVAYTAAYARRMEYGFKGTDSLGRKYNQPGRAFVRLAAQQWQRVCTEVATEAQKGATK